MSAEVVVAIIISVVAIFTAIISAIFSYLSQLRTIKLEHQLAEQPEVKSEEAQAKQLISKYRDPLLSAAYDLQSRLYNIVRLGFLRKYYSSPRYGEYAVNNTLYVVAEFLGWMEALHREVQFLDLGNVQANRTLVDLLTNVNRAFASDSMTQTFRLFRGEQRAIGELMHIGKSTTNPRGLKCIGFAEFSKRLEDPQFAQWFSGLKKGIELLAIAPEEHEQRLVALQHALIELINFLDPEHIRIPTRYRSRI